MDPLTAPQVSPIVRSPCHVIPLYVVRANYHFEITSESRQTASTPASGTVRTSTPGQQSEHLHDSAIYRTHEQQQV